MKKKEQTGKEVWRVHIQDMEYVNEYRDYSVFANSAAQAEKRSLELAEKEGLQTPTCTEAKFETCVM